MKFATARPGFIRLYVRCALGKKGFYQTTNNNNNNNSTDITSGLMTTKHRSIKRCEAVRKRAPIPISRRSILCAHARFTNLARELRVSIKRQPLAYDGAY